jgi:hypothetical protein
MPCAVNAGARRALSWWRCSAPDAAAEGKIASTHQATGLQVFSLYGETRRPTPPCWPASMR